MNSKFIKELNPIKVISVIFAGLIIISILGYFILDTPEEYATVEDFQLYQTDDYKIQYPTDWTLQEGEMVMLFNRKYFGTDQFTPNLSIAKLSNEKEQILDLQTCKEFGGVLEIQYQASLDNPEIQEAKLGNTKYHENTCQVTATGEVDGIPAQIKQIMILSNQKIYVISYGYELENQSEKDILEKMVATFQAR